MNSVVVVGAGPAGLAVARCLHTHGITATVIERGKQIGDSWRRHYASLRLHTTAANSTLPGQGFPHGTPRYPSRDEVVRYLSTYATEGKLDVRLDESVEQIERTNGGWRVATSGKSEIHARRVVIATGMNDQPIWPDWADRASYRGDLRHGSEIRDAGGVSGAEVLVVGLGNTGADLAAAFAKAGARVTVAVRGPIFAVPLEVAGSNWREVFRWAPERVGRVAERVGIDKLITAIAARYWSGLAKRRFEPAARRGLQLMNPGELAAYWRLSRPAVTAEQTLALIGDGQIRVTPAVERIDGDGVTFVDQRLRGPFDRVILATGYHSSFDVWLQRLDPGAIRSEITFDGRHPKLAGIYFCGHGNELKAIAEQARRVSAAIARELAQ